MAPNAKDLEPIKDRKVIERYLRYTLDLKEILSCFLDQAGLRFEAEVKSFSAENLTLEADIRAADFGRISAEQLRRIDEDDTHLRISFTVQDVLFFAHARIKGRKTREILLAVDAPIFKLQRRDAVRIKVLEEHKANVTIEDKTYLLHDLSATGLSFVVMLHDESRFPRGSRFPGAQLRFMGIENPVELEVTGTRHMSKEGLYKVGMRFIQLSPAVEQKLAKEAYLHTHKIWSRWI